MPISAVANWPAVEGFPAMEEIPPGHKLNLGCGGMILPREEGWVNVDRTGGPGVDLQCDLWTLPWPLPDGEFSYVLMCHFAEHIPHEVRRSYIYAGPEWSATEPMHYVRRWEPERHPQEGWFAVFGEVYRLLRPGGQICIVAPYGLSWGAFQDPTHTRFIVPPTFAYFQAQDTPDYQVGYRYLIRSMDLIAPPGRLDPATPQEAVVQAMETSWNVGRTIKVVLEKPSESAVAPTKFTVPPVGLWRTENSPCP